MPKKLKKPGRITSLKAEIQNISHQGIWIFIDHQELFMPFLKFPWFLKATIGQIYNFQTLHKSHLYWPELDIDLDVESIKNPEAFPLTYREMSCVYSAKTATQSRKTKTTALRVTRNP